MRYSLERVMMQLMHHWKLYTIVILEFAIGIGLLFTCLNIRVSFQKTLDKERKEVAANEIPITIESAKNFVEGKQTIQALTYDEYMTLKNKKEYKDIFEMKFSAFTQSDFFLSDETFENVQVCSYSIWFLSKEDFKEQFGIEPQNETAYVGSTIREQIQEASKLLEEGKDSRIVFLSELFRFHKDSIDIAGKKSYCIGELPVSNDRMEVNPFSSNPLGDYTIDINSCIVLPLEDSGLVSDTYTNWLLRFAVQYKTNDFDDNRIAALLQDLASLHGDEYNYSVKNGYLMKEKQIEYWMINVNLITWVAVAILLIVTMGMAGVLHIFFYRRKKTIAIAISYGSTLKRVWTEAFVELWIVFLIGSFLGCILAYGIIPYVNSVYESVSFYSVGISFAIGTSVIAAGLSCLITLTGVKIKAPIEVLREV